MVAKQKDYLEKKISEILNSKIKLNIHLSNTEEDEKEDVNSVTIIAKQIADTFGGEIIN